MCNGCTVTVQDHFPDTCSSELHGQIFNLCIGSPLVDGKKIEVTIEVDNVIMHMIIKLRNRADLRGWFQYGLESQCLILIHSLYVFNRRIVAQAIDVALDDHFDLFPFVPVAVTEDLVDVVHHPYEEKTPAL